MRARYARRYADLAAYLERESYHHPKPVYAQVRRELPNLRNTLELLLQTGVIEVASYMASNLIEFLSTMGLNREREGGAIGSNRR